MTISDNSTTTRYALIMSIMYLSGPMKKKMARETLIKRHPIPIKRSVSHECAAYSQKSACSIMNWVSRAVTDQKTTPLEIWLSGKLLLHPFKQGTYSDFIGESPFQMQIYQFFLARLQSYRMSFPGGWVGNELSMNKILVIWLAQILVLLILALQKCEFRKSITKPQIHRTPLGIDPNMTVWKTQPTKFVPLLCRIHKPRTIWTYFHLANFNQILASVDVFLHLWELELQPADTLSTSNLPTGKRTFGTDREIAFVQDALASDSIFDGAKDATWGLKLINSFK